MNVIQRNKRAESQKKTGSTTQKSLLERIEKNIPDGRL